MNQTYEASTNSRTWFFSSAMGWLRANFILSSIFKKGNRLRVALSLASLYVFMFVFFPIMHTYLGIWGIFKFYIIPYVVYHFWMSTFISFAYRIPFTKDASLRVSIAFPTKYPVWVEWLTNDINYVLAAARSIQDNIPNHKIKRTFAYLRDSLSERMDVIAAQVTEGSMDQIATAAALASVLGSSSSSTAEKKEEAPVDPILRSEKASEVATAPKSFASKVNWIPAIFIVLTPLLWLYGALTTALMWQTLVLAIITYFIAGLGITVGYHRLFAHRAYEVGPVTRFFILMAGTSAFEGSCLWWSRDHRAHHRYVDTDKDPYNAQRGFFYAHMGWVLQKQDRTKIGKADTVDLDADPLLKWQDRFFLPLATLTGILIPTCIAGFGWGDWRGGFFFGSVARSVFVMQSTFCVNSVAHWFGDHTFTDEHTPRDSWFVSLLTLGEGYHNFHHEFPYDYRNGVKNYAYDPSKWTIWVLGKLGLAYNLKRFPENEIKKGELQMIRKRLDRNMHKLEWGMHPDEMPTFTMEEVKRRCANEGTSLIVVDGFVHDVHHFIEDHPGGKALIQSNVGKDASWAFHGGVYGHSNGARNLLTRFRIGRMADSECTERSYGRPSPADAAAAEACFSPAFIAKKL
jgi:stearoyl-CoA desaturase (Delta-9 desaturase)